LLRGGGGGGGGALFANRNTQACARHLCSRNCTSDTCAPSRHLCSRNPCMLCPRFSCASRRSKTVVTACLEVEHPHLTSQPEYRCDAAHAQETFARARALVSAMLSLAWACRRPWRRQAITFSARRLIIDPCRQTGGGKTWKIYVDNKKRTVRGALLHCCSSQARLRTATRGPVERSHCPSTSA